MVGGACGLIAIIAVVALATASWRRPPYKIPSKLVNQASFSIYVPTPGATWRPDPQATTYDASAGVLAMTFKADGLPTIVMNQQAQPAVFNDVPNYFPQLLAKMNQYREISTDIGPVQLTRPTELGGGQSAVGNVRGTLTFAHPSVSLSDTQWKAFFDQLQVLR